MMSLCFSGCSITWGDELQNRLKERYSTLVSDHYKCGHVNISKCGVSNDYIARNTIKHLQNTSTDVAVVQFTVTSRIEYYDKKKDPQLYTPQWIRTNTQKDYYTKVYNDVLGVENMWKNIFLVDSYCKSVGQKYVSLIADHFEPSILRPQNFYNGHVGYWRQLCKNYNPSLIQFHLLGGDRDNPENYAQGKNGGHPSAEGHKIMAEKVIELIDAI
tara:strand:+ start:23 stop:667 length:645 start_codon:yes stop_codon:yes gene_type:complete